MQLGYGQQLSRPAARAVPIWTAALFTVAVLVHGADHVRRGVHVAGDDVFWLGTFGVVLECAVVVFVAQRHRYAPEAALGVGASLALGYIGVHFLPAHPWFSDSFTSGTDVSPLSWIAAIFEVIAALTLSVAGYNARRTPPEDRAPSRPVASAVRHPVSLLMIAGNVVILAIGFAQ